MIDRIPIRRALVCVYDKTGLDDLARGLDEAGVELVSTGVGRRGSTSLGLPVTKVEDLTGFPECLDGRVKTLHPTVHAGILADRRLDSHVQQLADLGIEPFDLRGVQPLPVRADRRLGRHARRVRRADRHRRPVDGAGRGEEPPVGRDRHLARRATPTCWPPLAAGGFTLEQRKRLAAEAFAHTAAYDVQVASWMGSVLTDTSDGTGFPALGRRDLGARGGAALRREPAPAGRALRPLAAAAWPHAEQLHGKEMSYNNYVDTDAARRAAYDFAEPAVAIIKHANPCGIAIGADVAEAHRKAHACDPVSAFGGVIAVNRPVSVEMAEQRRRRSSPRSIVAPAYDDGAVEAAGPAEGRKNLRILRCAVDAHPDAVEFRAISGGC